MAKEEKRVLTLDKYEHGVVINALNEMRNDLIGENRPTDAVDDVLLKPCAVQSITDRVEEVLALVRRLIRCDVLEEPVPQEKLCGLTEAELRQRSHRPQEYYGIPHFMPAASDGEAIARLNRARCAARAAELAAVHAYPPRTDLLQAANRLSSALYLIMIRLKADR